MFCDGILYFLIALYIDNVFPGQYGVPKVRFDTYRLQWRISPLVHKRDIERIISKRGKPFYFFLQPSFWTGKQKKSSYDDEEAIQKETVPVEYYSDHREVGVELINLKKVYNQGSCSSKEKVAVNELRKVFKKVSVTIRV